MKKINKVIAGLFSAAALLFAGCVGLGEEVDLKGPSLKISYPEVGTCVRQGFNIVGSADDNTAVTQIEITCNETHKTWKIVEDKWFSKTQEESDWSEVAEAELTPVSKGYSFKVPIEVDEDSSIMDYSFDISAFDKNKNGSKDSKVSIKVTVDKAPPVVTVLQPALEVDKSNADSNLAKYKLYDNSCLNRLVNGSFSVKGSQEEDNPKKIEVILDNGNDLTAEESDVVYARKEITDPNILRNWSADFTVEDLAEAYRTGKRLVRVLVIATDRTDELFEKKAHGWFVLYPEADKPWVVPNFGSNLNYDDSEIFPNYNIQGQAYDDDGLQLITAKVFDEGGKQVISQNFDLSAKNEPYYSWVLKAPPEKGNFYAEISVKDKNGVAGETVKRYFHVKDTTPPTIDITSHDSGDVDLGTEVGNITIKGVAKDDGEISTIRVVKIAQGHETSQLNYLDAKSNLWNAADQSVDSDGNKLYILYPVGRDAGQKNEVNFEKTFNLFSDFGIDGTNGKKASNQLFIFLAKDRSGESVVKAFSLSGDTEAPSLTIDSVFVNNVKYDLHSENLTLKSWNRDSNDKITDKVKLSGTWGDNTYDIWHSVSRINDVSVKWAGLDESVKIPVTMNEEKTWVTGEFTPSNSTTASISASLTDWGGNTKNASASFYIESNKPEWARISSANSDGSYKAGSEILITMEFNKSITFAGGAQKPVLELNNGKTAVYKDGNGSSKHIYSYIVETDDDIDRLDVNSLKVNGNTWSDGSDDVKMSVLPAAEKSLAGGRNIQIDTKAPVISKVTAISSNGYYKAEKSIFMSVEFNEKVSITNADELKLSLNSGKNGAAVYAENATVTSDKTIMFTYTIKDTENTSSLAVKEFISGSAVISDVAKNVLTSKTLPAGNPFSGIVIDTTKPEVPSVVISSESKTIYETTGATITVSTTETDSVIEYSIDGGSSWTSYKTPVTLSDNGQYTVIARQTDKAGNQSDDSTGKIISIDKGNILTSVSSTKTDGTYTYNKAASKGDVIPVTLSFRKPVTVSAGATLTLNTTPVKTAVLDESVTTGKLITFKYTVGENDSCNKLEVTSINGTFKDSDNIDVTDYCTEIPENAGLGDNRTIKIVTGNPVVQKVELEDNLLTVTFNEDISKMSGSVLISQNEDGYRVPVVLSPAQFNEYKSISGTVNSKAVKISDIYVSGVNGADSNCISDTTEKFILNYAISNTNEGLVEMFKKAGALEVEVPVASSNVTVNGTKLIMDLSGSYELPVKGAQYTVEIPENLVKNNLGHGNEADETIRSITPAGIETPTIRVNKALETITNQVAKQPMTTGVKFECQTPGSDVVYTTSQALIDITATRCTVTQAKCEAWWPNGAPMAADGTKPSAAADPSGNSGRAASSITIGSDTDYTHGYKVLIRAKGRKSKTGSGYNYSDDAYEYACRSVVRVEERGGSNYYIRGGDLESGGVTTPGFPFSWHTGEFDKVRLMTKNGSYWYFITWNINVNAYFGFLSGDVPDDVYVDGVYKGPKSWTWATCAFVSSKSKYPLYPGEGVTLTTNGWSDSWNNGTWMGQFQFQDKQKEHRQGGSGGTLIPEKE